MRVRIAVSGTILMVIAHNTEHRTEVMHILHRLGVADLTDVNVGVRGSLLHNP
jgi:hypothetical protein